MSRFIAIALVGLFACLLPNSAHAQLTGPPSQQLVCLQLYTFFAPDAAETRAMHDAVVANGSNGPAAALDAEQRVGVERLHTHLAAHPEAKAQFLDALPSCVNVTGMPSPAVAADGSIPPMKPVSAQLLASDGGIVRCASLFRGFEIVAKEDMLGSGTFNLVQKIATEQGMTFGAASTMIESNGELVARHGTAGTTMKALIAEALACSTRYDVLIPQTVLEDARELGLPADGPRDRFCDYQFGYFDMNAPRADSFISQLRNHHQDDAKEFIEKGFRQINFYRRPMKAVGCPASWMDRIDARENAFVAALEAYAPEFNARGPKVDSIITEQ